MSHYSTLNFYEEKADIFIEQTLDIDMSAIYKPFIDKLNADSISYKQILDLGCGSGRDSLYFAKLGFNVTAIDGSLKLIETAKEDYTIPNIFWEYLTFEQTANRDWQSRFDGIWACASLLHVPYNNIAALLDKLLSLLKKEGVFYASFKYGDSERIEENRFFCDMNETRWQAIKLKLNNTIKDTIWLTSDQRKDCDSQWFNVLIEM